jgi:hypothetical protein
MDWDKRCLIWRHPAAAGGTAISRMTPKLPDTALHSCDLSLGPFENGDDLGKPKPPEVVPKKITLVA